MPFAYYYNKSGNLFNSEHAAASHLFKNKVECTKAKQAEDQQLVRPWP